MRISKNNGPIILISVSFLVIGLFLAPILVNWQKTAESQLQIQAEETSDPSAEVDPFFASAVFTSNDYSFEIFPYHVGEVEDILEWDWEKVEAQLQADYVDFDPLVLLKENPEVLVKNFTNKEGEITVSLENLLRARNLWEKLDDFAETSELWTPSSTNSSMQMPENFVYGSWDELLYVDLSKWEKTDEEYWKHIEEPLDPNDDMGLFKDYIATNFKLIPEEEGFILMQELSFEGAEPGGSISQHSYILYSYDAAGRFQEGFLVKKTPGITKDEPIFRYYQAFYDENGKLSEFHSSNVSLRANQLSVPLMLYTSEEYLAN